VDDTTYLTLVKMRKKAGLPSVSALFLRKTGVLTDQMEASAIARSALTRAKKKASGSEFRLRDLFQQQEWERYSKGARLRAGKMFNAKIGSAIHGIKATRKSSTNHQYYESA